MPFIIIETKSSIKNFKHVILDILSKSYEITKIEESDKKLIIYHEIKRLSETDLFFNLSEEIFADLKVFISDDVDKFDPLIINEWLEILPFNQTIIYTLSQLMLKRTEFSIDEKFRKTILKSTYNDKELLNTVKIYLETNQNMSKASEKLYLHRNTLIQRLNKFNLKTGFDCKKFVDAYIIYSVLK